MKLKILLFLVLTGTIIYSCNYNMVNTPADISNLNKTTAIDTVGLYYFDIVAENDTVKLTWTTEFENNNYGFEIQISNDGETFEKIGFIAGQGTIEEYSEYIFIITVDNPLEKVYRLKIISMDGNYYYSPIINSPVIENRDINMPSYLALHQNYPNPFDNTTTISYMLPQLSIVSLKIYDVFDDHVKTFIKKQQQQAGHFQIVINCEGLEKGLYYYEIEANNHKIRKTMLYNPLN